MKTSIFNYIVPNGDKTIFYNGISESFFEVPKNKSAIYEEILKNPSKYSESFLPFLNRMIEKGFVLDDQTDEYDILEDKFCKTSSNGLYHIMILPTYQCNLRCWYCVQDHKDLWMSKDTVREIKMLLRNKVNDDSIKAIRLSWFGGEPLLGYETILDITSFTKHLTSDVNKPFICDITTNGTLLDKERITALNKAGVTNYQITIDGNKETHDSIKVLPDESAFDKTLENINFIAESTKCSLRFNYTHDNLKPESIIENIKSRINEKNRPNITFLIYKVWQEPQDLIDESDVHKIIDMSEKIGIRPKLPTCNFCYADNPNFNCIFPNGKVEKCDNESPLAAKGYIADGEIQWNGDIKSHIPAFRNPLFPCKKCKYVPVCWGPCVAKRDHMLRTMGKGKCQYEDKGEEMRRYIINRCINLKKEHNNVCVCE